MLAKILIDRAEAVEIAEELRQAGKKLVFTNGCFDIIHAGHVAYLAEARRKGDALMIGVNDDNSVCHLKGPTRPIMPLADRMLVLASLRCVDYVVAFHEDTPSELISVVKPQILVKGGDYRIEDIIGSDTLKAYGGEVIVIPFLPGRSTSDIITKVLNKEECR